MEQGQPQNSRRRRKRKGRDKEAKEPSDFIGGGGHGNVETQLSTSEFVREFERERGGRKGLTRLGVGQLLVAPSREASLKGTAQYG
jgi:hypothetical protein